MKFDFLTIFPEVITPYVSTSILKRAAQQKKAFFDVHNLRDFTHNKHKTVDDTPYGGGAGMVMRIEPIAEAIDSLIKPQEREKTRIILLSAKGNVFSQGDANRLMDYERIIFICGRYEGIDERVALHIADEEMSIGSYVLTGGELPALAICDAVTRLIPGVLGNISSLQDESHGDTFKFTYPQYTRPESYRNWSVPRELLEGNHSVIEAWRKTHAKPRRKTS